MLKLFLVFVYISVCSPSLFLPLSPIPSSFESESHFVALVGPATQLCRPACSYSVRSAYLCFGVLRLKACAIMPGGCFILFYCKVAFHCMDKTHTVYLFIRLWTFDAFFPVFKNHCKQSCSDVCVQIFLWL